MCEFVVSCSVTRTRRDGSSDTSDQCRKSSNPTTAVDSLPHHQHQQYHQQRQRKRQQQHRRPGTSPPRSETVVSQEEWQRLAAKFGRLFRTQSSCRALVDASTAIRRRLELDRLRRDVRRKPCSSARFALGSWDVWRERLDGRVKVKGEGGRPTLRSVSLEDVNNNASSSSSSSNAACSRSFDECVDGSVEEEGELQELVPSLLDDNFMIQTWDGCRMYHRTNLEPFAKGSDCSNSVVPELEEKPGIRRDVSTPEGKPSALEMTGTRDADHKDDSLSFSPKASSDEAQLTRDKIDEAKNMAGVQSKGIGGSFSNMLEATQHHNSFYPESKVSDPVFEKNPRTSRKFQSSQERLLPPGHTVIPKDDITRVEWDDVKPRSCSLGDDVRSSVSDFGSSRELLDSSISDSGYFCHKPWQRSASDDSDLGSSKDDLSSRSSCNDTMVDSALLECPDSGVFWLVNPEFFSDGFDENWERGLDTARGGRRSDHKALQGTSCGGGCSCRVNDKAAGIGDDVAGGVIGQVISKKDNLDLSSETVLQSEVDDECMNSQLANSAQDSYSKHFEDACVENLDSIRQSAPLQSPICLSELASSTSITQAPYMHSQTSSRPLKSSSEDCLQRILSFDRDLRVDSKRKYCVNCLSGEKLLPGVDANGNQEVVDQENNVARLCNVCKSDESFKQTNSAPPEETRQRGDKTLFLNDSNATHIQPSDISSNLNNDNSESHYTDDETVDAASIESRDPESRLSDVSSSSSSANQSDFRIPSSCQRETKEVIDGPEASSPPDSPEGSSDQLNDSTSLLPLPSNRKCYVYLEEDVTSEEAPPPTAAAASTATPASSHYSGPSTSPSSCSSSLESLSSRKSRRGSRKTQQHLGTLSSSCLKSVTSALRRIPSPGKYLLTSHRSVYDLQLAALTYFPVCPASPEEDRRSGTKLQPGRMRKRSQTTSALPHLLTFNSLSDLSVPAGASPTSPASYSYSSSPSPPFASSQSLQCHPSTPSPLSRPPPGDAPPYSPVSCPRTPPSTPTASAAMSPKTGWRPGRRSKLKDAKTFPSPLLSSSNSSVSLFSSSSSSSSSSPTPLPFSSPSSPSLSSSLTLPFLSKRRARSLSLDSRMANGGASPATTLPRPSKRASPGVGADLLEVVDCVDSARIGAAVGSSSGNSLPIHHEFDSKKVDRHKQPTAWQAKAKQEKKAQQFGLSLQEIKNNTGRIIPRPVEDTIDFLKSANADEIEGLFRRCARVSTMREVQEKYDDGETVDFCEYGDCHLAGAILKKFLRELSEPLMTFELFEPITRLHFLEQSKQVGEVQRILKDELPEDNYIILKHIFQFLQQVISKSDINLMTAANLATVFGPNIAWPKGQANLSNVEQAVKFALILLENFDDVFLR